jgi:exodeoxyribonuclease VII small subunit
MVASNKKGLDFEAALSELESIVSSMESGKITLDESLKRYERGIELLRSCNEMLSAAEQRIAILDSSGLHEFKDSASTPPSDKESA